MAGVDAGGVVGALAGQVDAWHLAGLEAGARGQSVDGLAARLADTAAGRGERHAHVATAIAAALAFLILPLMMHVLGGGIVTEAETSRLIGSGELESFKIGRSTRVTVASVKALVERRLAEARGEG